MRGALAPALAVALGAAGCRCSGDAPGSAPAPAATPVPVTPWPRADRTFCVDLDGKGRELVAGADGDELWVAEPAEGGTRVRLRAPGEGQPQLVTAGDFGRGRRLYVARGGGPRSRHAPLVLQEIDPETGAVIELWKAELERIEAVELEIVDVDRDKKPDLAFAYYATKTQVRTRHLTSDGRVIEGPLQRTAQARAFADLDGDGIADAIVGRLYGEGTGAISGDLGVDLGRGVVTIPTQGGVRAIAAAREPDGKPSLYFADGWAAAYQTEGRARIKRARWNGTGFDVEQIAASPEEFTFFALTAVEQETGVALIGSGNARVTLFPPGAEPRAPKPLGGPGKGVTAACREGKGGFVVWAPGEPVAPLR